RVRSSRDVETRQGGSFGRRGRPSAPRRRKAETARRVITPGLRVEPLCVGLYQRAMFSHQSQILLDLFAPALVDAIFLFVAFSLGLLSPGDLARENPVGGEIGAQDYAKREVRGQDVAPHLGCGEARCDRENPGDPDRDNDHSDRDVATLREDQMVAVGDEAARNEYGEDKPGEFAPAEAAIALENVLENVSDRHKSSIKAWSAPGM